MDRTRINFFRRLSYWRLFNRNGRVASSGAEVIHNSNPFFPGHVRPWLLLVWNVKVSSVKILGKSGINAGFDARVWRYHAFLEHEENFQQGRYSSNSFSVANGRLN